MMNLATASAAALTVGTLVGAFAVPSSASPSAPPAERAMHTQRLVALETASHSVGSNNFVGTDQIRSRSSHKVVGYDSFTLTVDPKTDVATFWVALALKGGIIEVRVRVQTDPEPPIVTVPIVHGSGKYRGIKGTVRFAETSPVKGATRNYVTLRYRL